MADVDFDPIQVEIWRNLLAAIPEEMGATLERTAFSPNIKERLDHSCAIFSASGKLLAQAAHIPVHLGAMPLMMEALRTRVRWSPGVMWLCNDPRVGGTHLPDLTLVAPVYLPFEGKRTLVGYVASRAHHADIGGISPGSLPLSTEPYHEGLILAPVRLVERGRVRADIQELVCANSRTPAERRGDLAAQIAANETGIRRFQELIREQGYKLFEQRCEESLRYAESVVRRTLAEMPLGSCFATDFLDSDGVGGEQILIRLCVTRLESGGICFDFSGSAPQVRGSLNATEAITRSACYFVVRCLVEEEIPTNEGCFAPVEVIAPEGTVVNARFPAAVAAGNVETSQRLVDVILLALAQFLPERTPACSQGTMNNVTIGGTHPNGRPFAYYETLAGGAGGSPFGAGASAIHSHMTNTRNTPIESLEAHYPLRVLEYGIAEGTGGQGTHAGGCGLVRRIRLLSEAHVALITERRESCPPGLYGGAGGTVGENLIELPNESPKNVGGKWSGICPEGTIITVRTPGGGGWGRG
jgi:N-methylhydantoinase B